MPQELQKPVYTDSRGKIQLPKGLERQPFILNRKANGAIELLPAITIPIENAQNDPEVIAAVELANQEVRDGHVVKMERNAQGERHAVASGQPAA